MGDGGLGLVHVVGDVDAGAIGRDEAGQPLDLILLHQAQVECDHEQQDRSDAEEHQVANGHAGHRQKYQKDDRTDDGSTQVGLLDDQEDRQPRHEHHPDEVPEVEAFRSAGAVRADGDDEHQGGELGWLDLEWSEGEPALGAECMGADRREHGQQCQNDPHVQDGGQMLPSSVVEECHHHQDQEGKDEEGELALDVVPGVLASQGELALGGRVDHDDPGEGQDAGRDQEDRIDPGGHVPRAGGECVGRVGHQGAPDRQATLPSGLGPGRHGVARRPSVITR